MQSGHGNFSKWFLNNPRNIYNDQYSYYHAERRTQVHDPSKICFLGSMQAHQLEYIDEEIHKQDKRTYKGIRP